MEVFFLEVLNKQVAHILPHRLNRLLQRRALVHHNVFQVRLERRRHGVAGGVLVAGAEIQALHLAVDIVAANGRVGRAQRQAQHLRPARNAVHLGNVQLKLADLAALDGLERLLDRRLDRDVALE